MAQKNQQLFQMHQKSFYVHSNDSIQVKILKLEILTCLANESNISAILREFQVEIVFNILIICNSLIYIMVFCIKNRLMY